MATLGSLVQHIRDNTTAVVGAAGDRFGQGASQAREYLLKWIDGLDGDSADPAPSVSSSVGLSRRQLLGVMGAGAVTLTLPGCLLSSKQDGSASAAAGRNHDFARDGALPIDEYFVERFKDDALNLSKNGNVDARGNFFSRYDAIDRSLENDSLPSQRNTFELLQQNYRDLAMEYLLITANHARNHVGITIDTLADLQIAEALSVSRSDARHLRSLIAEDQEVMGYDPKKHLPEFKAILEQRLVQLHLYDNLADPIVGDKMGKKGQINFSNGPFKVSEEIRSLTPVPEFTKVFQGYTHNVPSEKSVDDFASQVHEFYGRVAERATQHSGILGYDVNERGATVTALLLDTESLFKHVDAYLASIETASHSAREPNEGVELNRLLRLIEHGEGSYSSKKYQETRKLAAWHGARLRRGLAWDEMNMADTQYEGKVSDLDRAEQSSRYFAAHFLAGSNYFAKVAHHKRAEHKDNYLKGMSHEDIEKGYERILVKYGPDVAEHYGGLAITGGVGAAKLAGLVLGGMAIHDAATSGTGRNVTNPVVDIIEEVVEPTFPIPQPSFK
jgi:hypothetical protein